MNAPRLIHGLTPPANIGRDWECVSLMRSHAAELLQQQGIPVEWGRPLYNACWFDLDLQLRLLVAEYGVGRRVTMRRQPDDSFKTATMIIGTPPAIPYPRELKAEAA